VMFLLAFLSSSLSAQGEDPWFLFSILFHVTCFKLRFIWIIKCFLKESFYTASLFFKVNYWCSDKLKRLRIIIFFSPLVGTQEMSSDNGCLFRIIQRKHKGKMLNVVLEKNC
jgi:hypothetical protein